MTLARRVHERYALELSVVVILSGSSEGRAREIRGKTRNLSLGGALIALEQGELLPYGIEVKVRLDLAPLREEATVPATVRWMKEGAMGVQFGSLRAKEVWALNQLFKGATPAPASKP